MVPTGGTTAREDRAPRLPSPTTATKCNRVRATVHVSRLYIETTAGHNHKQTIICGGHRHWHSKAHEAKTENKAELSGMCAAGVAVMVDSWLCNYLYGVIP